MSTVRQASDTFIRLLADNLDASTPVHVLRTDAADRSADSLAMNSVNLMFLDASFSNGSAPAGFQISIDVINDDSNLALDWVQAVVDILQAAFFTRVFDYTNPAAPVASNSNIYWDSRIRFKRVTADINYAHFTCTLQVNFRSI